MKIKFILLFHLLIFTHLMAQQRDNRFFELRTYYTHDGRMPALISRFQNHTLQIFERHGMTNIGYWVASSDSNKLMYILAYPNREARDQAWKDFSADPEWQKVATDSEKDGKIVAKVESVFMTLADFSPALIVSDNHNPSRVFELRMCTMLPGKFPDIVKRSANQTKALFSKHGMTNVAYWISAEGEGQQPRLIYILAHASEEAAKQSFANVRVDPEWMKVKAKLEKNVAFTDKIESQYMKPLVFSKIN